MKYIGITIGVRVLTWFKTRENYSIRFRKNMVSLSNPFIIILIILIIIIIITLHIIIIIIIIIIINIYGWSGYTL